MKTLFMIFLSACLSCQSSNNSEALKTEIDLLNYRIDNIESKLDSLIAKITATSTIQKGKAIKKPTMAPLPLTSTPSTSPASSSNYSSTSNRSVQSYSIQCQAITKKGAQCKRNARSGGYCWQHGG